jgi:hypothetical protein
VALLALIAFAQALPARLHHRSIRLRTPLGLPQNYGKPTIVTGIGCPSQQGAILKFLWSTGDIGTSRTMSLPAIWRATLSYPERREASMTGHLRKRGNAWAMRAHVGIDPLTDRLKYRTPTSRGGKREAEEARAARRDGGVGRRPGGAGQDRRRPHPHRDGVDQQRTGTVDGPQQRVSRPPLHHADPRRGAAGPVSDGATGPLLRERDRRDGQSLSAATVGREGADDERV